MAITNKEERAKRKKAYEKYLKDLALRTKMAKDKRDKLKTSKRKSSEEKKKAKKKRMLEFQQLAKEKQIASKKRRASSSSARNAGTNIKKLQWLNTGI